MLKEVVEGVGLVAAVVLPLWNIPLILKIIKRRSSRDFSLAWVLGVWICIILMFPSGLMSHDLVWRTFNIVNLVLFSSVTFTVIKYRHGK